MKGVLILRIGLIGYARSGKDTVAQMIQTYLYNNGHGNTKRIAFGDEMKERFYDCFPEAHGSEKPRDWYETFGELGRQIDPNMWIRPVEYAVKNWYNIFPNIVLTDIRQPNEAKWAKENGFTLVEVWSSPEVRQERAKGDKNWKEINPSEKLLKSIVFNYVTGQNRVFNSYDLENTKEQVEELLGRLLENARN